MAGLLVATVVGNVGALLGGFLGKELFGVEGAGHVPRPEYLGYRDRRRRVVLFLLFGAVRGRGGWTRRTGGWAWPSKVGSGRRRRW
jgi:hypothetical protein